MRRNRLLQHLSMIVLSSSALATALHAQTIDTRAAPTFDNRALGGTAANFFFQTIGETFLVPTGYGNLQSFSFFLNRNTLGQIPAPAQLVDFTYVAGIQALVGGIPAGAALFTTPT